MTDEAVDQFLVFIQDTLDLGVPFAVLWDVRRESFPTMKHLRKVISWLDEGDRAAVWDSRVTCHYLVLRYPELGSALDMTLHASAHHGALPISCSGTRSCAPVLASWRASRTHRSPSDAPRATPRLSSLHKHALGRLVCSALAMRRCDCIARSPLQRSTLPRSSPQRLRWSSPQRLQPRWPLERMPSWTHVPRHHLPVLLPARVMMPRHHLPVLLPARVMMPRHHLPVLLPARVMMPRACSMHCRMRRHCTCHVITTKPRRRGAPKSGVTKPRRRGASESGSSSCAGLGSAQALRTALRRLGLGASIASPLSWCEDNGIAIDRLL